MENPESKLTYNRAPVPEGLKRCYFCQRLYENKKDHPCFMSEKDAADRAFRMARQMQEARLKAIHNDWWESENEVAFKKRLKRRAKEDEKEWAMLMAQRDRDTENEERKEKARLKRERLDEMSVRLSKKGSSNESNRRENPETGTDGDY